MARSDKPNGALPNGIIEIVFLIRKNYNFNKVIKEKRMKNPLGIFSWYGFILPFEERITLIKEAGFTATSLWWEDEDAPFPMKKESMPRLVRDKGLLLENIHVPFNDSSALWSEDESVRTEIVQSHIQWLQDCAKFSIPRMVMHLTEGDNPPVPNRQGLRSMEELVNVAEELGVTIAIENTRRTDNVPYVLRHVQSTPLGFCFDSSHHRLTDKDFTLLKDYGDRLVATHLSDNDGLHDRHWLPGHGIINWDEVARAFSKTYEGCLTLEAYPTAEERRESPRKFLERAYQKVSGIQILLGKS